MDTSTKISAKTPLLYFTFFIPAVAMAIWAGRLDGQQCLLAVLGALGLALGAFCFLRRKDDLVHDFFLPIILFAALGGMTWAVRGSSGFGSVKGCVFAGVMWGAAWWFIARNPSGPSARRYTSGWIVLALTIGIGLSGARGWMQWSSFFDGILQTNTSQNESVEISPTYGFIWLFIAGMPWAGIGACLLAWCAAEKPLAAWQWAVRLFCGFGAAFFASWLYQHYPQWFLPLYSTMKERYGDLEANPNLKRLINDNGSAIRHLGLFLGFLLFELGRRDWKNVTLISTVGVVNGLGWSLCQNWKWSDNVWPEGHFNFWRCWESSGGISIGIAYGLAYYLVNRRTAPCHCRSTETQPGFPFFGVFSMLFMFVILAWYGVVNASVLFSAEGLKHAPFCAVLVYGLVLYFLHLRATLLDRTDNVDPAIPKLGSWAAHFGLMLLIAWFMMGPVVMNQTPDPATPWWARFDYLYLGVAVLYGVLYFLTALWKKVTVRPTEESTMVPFFKRYPNLDWLAIYLSLLIIAASFLRGELPAWKGWFWMVQETPPAWTGMLGLACLAFFGLAWCALSYFSPREDDAGLERFAVHLGLLVGLGMSLKNGTRGWAHVYWEDWHDEAYWGELFWRYIGPGMLIVLVAIVLLALARRLMSREECSGVPHAFALIVLVLAHQNLIAQFITGPPTEWAEVAFNIYYVLLFLITAVIFYHYHFMQTWVPFLAAGLDADGETGTSETDNLPSDVVGEEPCSSEANLIGAVTEESEDAALPEDSAESEAASEMIEMEQGAPEEDVEYILEVDDGVSEEIPEGESPDDEFVDPAGEFVEPVDENETFNLDDTPMFEEEEPTEERVEEPEDGEQGTQSAEGDGLTPVSDNEDNQAPRS